MDYIALGRSNLLVSRTSFGAEALRFFESEDDVVKIVKTAYDGGVNFFDVSATYQDSEKRLGKSLEELKIRSEIVLATKTAAKTADDISRDIELSLTNLKTDFIDLYQLENPRYIPVSTGDDGIFEKLLSLKKSGLIRHFGISTENFEDALLILNASEKWETIQYPFNMLCSEEVEKFARDSFENDIGFIAMRPLCGGVVDNIPLAIGYLRQFEGVVPTWGVRNVEELQQILYFTENPPKVDEQFREDISLKREFFN